MNKISEQEFARIYEGIYDNRAAIFRHNPVGTREVTILWMLLSCLTVYMSLTEIETPCFNGVPTAQTYRDAILFVLKNGRTEDFAVEPYLDKLIKE